MKGFVSTQGLSFQKLLPMGLKIFGILLVGFFLISMIIYGVSVYFESRLLKLGKETRNLHEDNQDLQITLDRLRSYQKVADASSKLQGLQVAQEVIDIAQKEKLTYQPPQEPHQAPPQEAYGY